MYDNRSQPEIPDSLFLRGLARLMDVFGTLNTYTADEDDYYALLSDWLSVEDDLRHAIDLYEESLK